MTTLFFLLATFVTGILSQSTSPSSSPTASPSAVVHYDYCAIAASMPSYRCSSFQKDAYQGLCNHDYMAYWYNMTAFTECVASSPSLSLTPTTTPSVTPTPVSSSLTPTPVSPSSTPVPSVYHIPDLGPPCSNWEYVENACAAPYQAVLDYYTTNALTTNYSYAKHIELLNIWNQCIAEAQQACLLAYPALSSDAPPGPSSRYTDIVILITLGSMIVLCILGFYIYTRCRRSPQKPAVNHSDPVVVVVQID